MTFTARPWLAYASKTLLAAAFLALAGGCTFDAAHAVLEEPGAAHVSAHREVDGLRVAIQDLSPPRRSLEHFGHDLVNHGYIPMLLCLELDARATGAFNVRRENLRLRFRDGTQLTPAHPREVFDEASFSRLHSAFGFFTVLPGFLAASSADSANGRLEDDLLEHALEGTRVSPDSRSYTGVVFFRLPEELWGDFTLEDANVDLTIHREPQRGSLGKPFEVTVPINP